jgi:hypothetical protein
MAKFYDVLTPELQAFIGRQRMFFVASAPSNGDGRVNLSPKGIDTLRILSEREIAYLDLTGSGNETAAHLRQNGRVTFMWCSFDEKPWIVRAYCTGRSVQPRDPEWEKYASLFNAHPGARQIIVAAVQSAQSSCGFAVPRYEFIEQRPLLTEWTIKKGDDGIRRYWADKNQSSIDGLPTGLLADDS